MLIPDKPNNETQRLAALKLLNILDTPSEERFDRLTRLAKRLLDVPVALVCLVDEDRQWFKSADGIGVKEAPRDISFCGHAILQDDLFQICDTHRDERFADNPMVLFGPQVRFYAGFPLHVPGGGHVGTFFVADTQPRELSEDLQETLIDLAKIAERELTSSFVATTDIDTGLCNRLGFSLIGQKILKRASAAGTTAEVVLLRLAGIDEGGERYDSSDELVKHFAAAISQCNVDLSGRLSPQSFALMLSDAGKDGAANAVQSLREQLRAITDGTPASNQVTLTSKTLYSTSPGDGIDDMLRQGEQLLLTD